MQTRHTAIQIRTHGDARGSGSLRHPPSPAYPPLPFPHPPSPTPQSLKPYVHYLPWWVRTPDDLMERVEWLGRHAREAEDIAAAGQLFATTYLNSQARACYWLAVLQRLGRTLSYRPHLGDHPTAVRAEDFRDQGLLGIRRLPGQRALHGQPFEP